ncbi:DUF5655 domain-containing protein [Empedobacter brevis]|uniref:DUF5655 domain-containing protein n=1 Tax=Empedobacter brevis TaxID=247 RepID=UPI0028A17910|nr:DUF5655 domain-containing protein [Empedobacter brevis]
MQILTLNNNTLSNLKEKPFKLEKEIQNLFEANLTSLTGYEFIKSEFSIKGFRIDTLAFDPESNSFVIIEYKKITSHSVVDQGFTYLGLALEHKADFVLEYNESQQNTLKRTDVDWTQCRVLFVSPSFTEYQKQAANFKDLPIELWEIKRYENDLVIINPIKKDKSTASFKQLKQNNDSEIGKIVHEIKVYTEDEHLEGKSDDIIELYDAYKNAILSMIPEVEIRAKKLYISYELSSRILVDFVIQKSEIKMYINIQGKLFTDLKDMGVIVTDKTKWGRGYYQIVIKDSEHLEYIMSLIKQAII